MGKQDAALFNVGELLEKLRISRNQFEYLFLSRRLNRDSFRIGGKLIFSLADIEIVKKAIRDVKTKC